jgi:hypothetical protein
VECHGQVFTEKRKEIMVKMNLPGITLSERTEPHKAGYCKIPFI